MAAMTGGDIIVIGGGLAGAAFAIELARNGCRVTLLERSRAPGLKVCGDFLSGEALDLLAGLGFDPGHLGATPIGRMTLSGGGRQATTALPFQAAGLSRSRLDEALLAGAARSGVNVLRGITATDLNSDGTLTRVDTAATSFSAKAVALATGKHNLRGWRRANGAVTAFKIQFALSEAATADLAGGVQLALFEGGHIGACLIENDLATICWQIETSRLKDLGADWREQLAGSIRDTPIFRDLLAGSKPVQSRPAAISNLPFGYVRKTPIARNVFPIGDQMAVIPSFTGNGTAIALSSGLRAARAHLRGESAIDYQADFARRIRRQFALSSGINRIFQTRIGRSVGIGTLRAIPSLAMGLARITRHDMATHSDGQNPLPL